LPVLSIIETVVGKPLAALPELELKITTGHGALRTERVFRSVILRSLDISGDYRTVLGASVTWRDL
jgi:hypothetical protein